MPIKFKAKHKNIIVNILLLGITLLAVWTYFLIEEQSAVQVENSVIYTKKYKPLSETTYDVQDKKFIIVTGEYEPYVYSEDGVIKGFEYDMMVAILDEMGVDYEIQMMSWARGIYLLENGRVFGAFPYSMGKERELLYKYTDSLINAKTRRDYFFSYGDKIKINDFDDLKRYKIGAVNGSYYINMFEDYILEYDISITELETLKKLREGRIDLVPMNPIVAKALIERHFSEDADSFYRSDFSIASEAPGDHLIVNRDDPRAEPFILLFNQVFYKLRTTGELQRYYNSQPD